ncbi:uncharacterized protein LOC135225320 [Macrobrachium nipponense]|uniref:uncharacterized protein LOC135225320 n=1 Tax=Macrobrachium nipponense TaxID=159736 RepID=UPI0030C86A15
MCLVQWGSRFLTETEARYYTKERELLAVTRAMAKYRLYLSGSQHFTSMTDHRPLIPILNHYTLDAIENPSLQQLKVKVAPYIFITVWRSGKPLCIPDALSHSPASYPTSEDEEEFTTSTAHGELVLYWPRIVIHAAFHRRTLAYLHNSYQGTKATRCHPRQTMFWAGIDANIKNTVESCDTCQQLLPSQQQECNDHPSQPFESVFSTATLYAPVFQPTSWSFTDEWQTKTEDHNTHAHPLTKLTISQRVRIQDAMTLRWDKVGIMMSRGRSRQ